MSYEANTVSLALSLNIFNATSNMFYVLESPYQVLWTVKHF